MWKRLPRKYKTVLVLLVVNLGLLGFSIWQLQNNSASSFLGGKGLTLDQQGNIYVSADVCFTKYNPDYTYIAKIGNCSYGGSFHERHKSVAVDPEGNFYNLVYVVSAPPHIEKFDSTGKLIISWGSKGSGEGQFNAPSSIAVDRAGMVYVLDSGNARIQKFDSNGKFLAKWDIGKVAASSTISNGIEEWELFSPAILGVDDAGQIYVATGQGIQKFDNAGRLLATITKSTTGLDIFNSLGDMAVDGAGNIYISDTGRRIAKLDSKGQVLSQWESKLSSSITSIGVGKQGKVYILLNNRPYEAYIQAFDSNGKLLGTQMSSASSLILWDLAVFLLGLLLFMLILIVLIMLLVDKSRRNKPNYSNTWTAYK